MTLDCECGYIARGETDEALVTSARRHAREVHKTDLTAETIVALAGIRHLGVVGSEPSTDPRPAS